MKILLLSNRQEILRKYSEVHILYFEMTATSQNYIYEIMNKLNPEDSVFRGNDTAAMDNPRSENP